jgi:hypothetical protein
MSVHRLNQCSQGLVRFLPLNVNECIHWGGGYCVSVTYESIVCSIFLYLSFFALSHTPLRSRTFSGTRGDHSDIRKRSNGSHVAPQGLCKPLQSLRESLQRLRESLQGLYESLQILRESPQILRESPQILRESLQSLCGDMQNPLTDRKQTGGESAGVSNRYCTYCSIYFQKGEVYGLSRFLAS